MIYSMVSIGEESGDLDGILDKTSAFLDEEADKQIMKTVALVEPIMIIFMAVMVGFIVISIAMPMFGLFKTIK